MLQVRQKMFAATIWAQIEQNSQEVINTIYESLLEWIPYAQAPSQAKGWQH